MSSTPELDSALLNVLPSELHAQVPALARLLSDAAGARLSPTELQNRLSAEPELAPLLVALAGRSFAVGGTSVSFSGGDLRGANVPIGNIVGQDLIVVNTAGGDYATGDTDKRQGQFFEGGLHIHYTPTTQAAPPTLMRPEPLRPPEAGPLIGRAAELTYFAKKLATAHIAVIAGMAGVGKTTLAAALARQAAPLDAIFWHAFHESEGIDTIIWRLAGFLAWHGQDELWGLLQGAQSGGRHLPPPELLFDYLAQALSGRGYVVCLDDLQFVDDDPLLDQITRQLRGIVQTGALTLIVTSRRQPAFAQPFDFAPLDGLSAADMPLLLAARGLELADDLAAELYARTEGNAQLLTLALDALRRAPNQSRLIGRLAEAESIERYLMSELDESLTDGERAVMSAVAILLGYPGTRDAIEAIADTSGVRRILSDLASRYLLAASEGEQGKEYRQHAIVQTFYYNLLGRRERQLLHVRAGSYYETDDPDALKAARHFQRAGEYARAARLATADVWALINQGQARQLRMLLDEFKADQIDLELGVAVRIARGEVCTFLGESQLAQEHYHAAYTNLSALPMDATVRQRKARVCWGMGELLRYEAPHDALTWIDRGLDEMKGTNSLLEADLQLKAGTIQIAMGEYVAALSAVQNGLSLLPDGASQLRAGALLNLGIIYCSQGEFEKGKDCYLRALELSQQLRDYWVTLTLWLNLGIETEIAGDWEGAVAYYRRALELAEQLGSTRHQARAESALGIVNTNQGNDAAAESHLSNCVALARRHHLTEYLIASLSSLADLYLRRAESGKAATALSEAEPLALEMDSKYQLPEIYRGWAQVQMAWNQGQAALEAAERSVTLSQELGERYEEGMSLRIQGQVLIGTGDRESAQEAFERSLALLADRDPYEAARTKAQWGRALVAGGDQERETGLLLEARTTFQALGATRDLTMVDELMRGSG